MKTPLLETENLVHSYNEKNVLNISALRVDEGEIFALLGPTGAGKSTFLRVLNFLERPVEGVIKWRGKAVASLRDRLALRRKMAMAFQEPLLFNTSVFNNVAYGLRVRGFSKGEIREEVGRTLRLFAIDRLAGRHVRQLSGGEAQRVALARALVIKPELLLLDEPLASLDPPTKDSLSQELLSILKKLGVTTVYVTHDQSEAFVMADRIGILDQGRLLQVGTPEEVFYRPNSWSVASFVGTETMLPGTVVGQEEGLASIEVGEKEGKIIEAVTDFDVGEKVTVCLRPEEVVIEKSVGADARPYEGGASVRPTGRPADTEGVTGSQIRASARNHFPAKITKIQV
ncbi:MAG: ABC transporter ATP-binding protein, partial [Actinomycetota bacterium]